MKNKKKNWRRILLRGSALMAAVFMCFAGSFPAFAAEDPADPGGSVTLIKAGTYRFNDVPKAPVAEYSQDIQFTIARYNPNTNENILISGSRIEVDVGSTDGGSNYFRGMWYYLDSSNIDLGANLPVKLTVYYYENSNGWNPYYSDLFQTITIPTDQDVSVEFAEWFRNNTVLVSSSSNVLEGEWTLRPYMTIPSRSFLLEANFTVTGFASADGVHYDFVGQCDSFHVLIDDGYDLAVVANVVSSVPNFEDYGESYPFLMHVYKEFSNGEISFAGFVEPVTFDFGDGVVVDDPYVYQWFTSNAVPHRDMWTLTDRLQAVAASIWSVIVTISSTIVSNPLLLFTTGFLFLGGCIALFSRLLARR